MHVLVTGAGGFIGQELATALISCPNVTALTLTDVRQPSPPSIKVKPDHEVKISCVNADLTINEACAKLFKPDVDVVYLLHGIMSGTAEENLDVGLGVNLDSIRRILDILRRVRHGIKVIYPSTLAVFGPSRTGEVVDERTMPIPGSSYGAQKLMCETLLNDYSRLGLLDARILRLPTVVVRPSEPSGAASSFASAIFRDALKGEKSVLPVHSDLEMWICSPRTVVRNMIHALDVPATSFEGATRVVNLPGLTVTVAQMLEALRFVGGEEKARLVEIKRDPAIEQIVAKWPSRFDTRWAKKLGFFDDGTLVDTIHAYIEEFGGNKEAEKPIAIDPKADLVGGKAS